MIYLTRHGETEWNRQKRVQGSKDSPLTAEGVLGAEKLGVRMGRIPLDYIIASPLYRAYRTASIIAGDRQIPIIKEDALKEIHCGDFEGLPFDEIWQRYPQMKQAMVEDPLHFKYPNGESLKEFYDRVQEGFKKIARDYEGKNILIVAHGGTVKGITTYIEGHLDAETWFKSVVSNCSLTQIANNNNKFTIMAYNEIDHLE